MANLIQDLLGRAAASKQRLIDGLRADGVDMIKLKRLSHAVTAGGLAL